MLGPLLSFLLPPPQVLHRWQQGRFHTFPAAVATGSICTLHKPTFDFLINTITWLYSSPIRVCLSQMTPPPPHPHPHGKFTSVSFTERLHLVSHCLNIVCINNRNKDHFILQVICFKKIYCIMFGCFNESAGLKLFFYIAAKKNMQKQLW